MTGTELTAILDMLRIHTQQVSTPAPLQQFCTSTIIVHKIKSTVQKTETRLSSQE